MEKTFTNEFWENNDNQIYVFTKSIDDKIQIKLIAIWALALQVLLPTPSQDESLEIRISLFVIIRNVNINRHYSLLICGYKKIDCLTPILSRCLVLLLLFLDESRWQIRSCLLFFDGNSFPSIFLNATDNSEVSLTSPYAYRKCYLFVYYYNIFLGFEFVISYCFILGSSKL